MRPVTRVPSNAKLLRQVDVVDLAGELQEEVRLRLQRQGRLHLAKPAAEESPVAECDGHLDLVEHERVEVRILAGVEF